MNTDKNPTTLYKSFINMTHEIQKHKWIESEKSGGDIGFENALVDWINNHRKNWIINYKIK